MTKKQALSFDYFSKRNAKKLEGVCSHCKAYKDWLTFTRWLAVGRIVKKGEHATRIPICIEEWKKGRSGRLVSSIRTVWAPVFCKCQTIEK